MALNLDARQRAMLEAMGIAVWLPEPPQPATDNAVAQQVTQQAVPAVAPQARTPAPAPAPAFTPAPVQAPVQPARQAPAADPVTPPVAAPRPASPPAPRADDMPAAAPQPQAPVIPAAQRPARRYVQQPAAGAPGLGWRLGPLRPVYPATAGQAARAGGWLILLEPPANSLPLPPAQRPGPDCASTALEGDAARLLDNMLRALNLHEHPSVYSAALHRVAPAPEGQEPVAAPAEVPPLQPALAAMMAELRPACVLVLGLASARAVLQRHEALGRLRAEPHRIAGVPAVVSYDPNYLLRAPLAKAGAWADLCHAQALVTGHHMPPGAASE